MTRAHRLSHLQTKGWNEVLIKLRTAPTERKTRNFPGGPRSAAADRCHPCSRFSRSAHEGLHAQRGQPKQTSLRFGAFWEEDGQHVVPAAWHRNAESQEASGKPASPQAPGGRKRIPGTLDASRPSPVPSGLCRGCLHFLPSPPSIWRHCNTRGEAETATEMTRGLEKNVLW